MPRRPALLIGNTKFENSRSFPPLRTPVSDVLDFAAALKKYGDFEILDTLVGAGYETINLMNQEEKRRPFWPRQVSFNIPSRRVDAIHFLPNFC